MKPATRLLRDTAHELLTSLVLEDDVARDEKLRAFAQTNRLDPNELLSLVAWDVVREVAAMLPSELRINVENLQLEDLRVASWPWKWKFLTRGLDARRFAARLVWDEADELLAARPPTRPGPS